MKGGLLDEGFVIRPSLFGNGVITIRGHADPKRVVDEFIAGGLKNKLLTRNAKDGKDAYLSKGGKKIVLSDPNLGRYVREILPPGAKECRASDADARFGVSRTDEEANSAALLARQSTRMSTRLRSRDQ